MDRVLVVLLSVAVLIATAIATFATVRLLRRVALFDHPNPRSSHSRPTPRGGGLAVVGVLLPVWLGIGLGGLLPAAETYAVGGAVVVLAILSWIDDVRDVAPSIRLAVQAVAVAAALTVMEGPFLGGLLPAPLDALAAGLLWLWFVNLFNFMDGIDGLAGAETAAIGIGVALVADLAGADGTLVLLGAAAAAAAFGFLPWNWPPAKVFLGDVGSVPLGFLLGWLLLRLAAEGQWAAALILPSYFLADATWTLARRTWRGERVWQAHREHFYQRAVRRGLGHARVSATVSVANAALIGLAALAASGRPWAAMGGAALVLVVLLAHLAGFPRAGTRDGARAP